jgi:hypothetical protein
VLAAGIVGTVADFRKCAYSLTQNTAGGDGIQLRHGNGINSLLTVCYSASVGAAEQQMTTVTPTAGMAYTLVGCINGLTAAGNFCFLNGVQYGATTDTSGSQTFNREGISYMRTNGDNNFSDDVILMVARGSKTLPLSLARDLSLNPWQLFSPVQRRVWVQLSAAAGEEPPPPVYSTIPLFGQASL